MLTLYPPSSLVLSTSTTGRSMIASRGRRRSCSRGWWWTLRQRRWRRRPWTRQLALLAKKIMRNPSRAEALPIFYSARKWREIRQAGWRWRRVNTL